MIPDGGACERDAAVKPPVILFDGFLWTWRKGRSFLEDLEEKDNILFSQSCSGAGHKQEVFHGMNVKLISKWTIPLTEPCINVPANTHLVTESFIQQVQTLFSFGFSLVLTHIHFLSIFSAQPDTDWAHGHRRWGRKGGVFPSQTHSAQERTKHESQKYLDTLVTLKMSESWIYSQNAS